MVSELKVVHPAMAKWLEKEGFSYQHEVETDMGVADFVAHHPDGRKWVIECKDHATEKAIFQVVAYKTALGADYQVVVAIPEWTITEEFRKRCEKTKTIIVLLNCDIEGQPTHQEYVDKNKKNSRRDVRGNLWIRYEKIGNEKIFQGTSRRSM